MTTRQKLLLAAIMLLMLALGYGIGVERGTADIHAAPTGTWHSETASGTTYLNAHAQLTSELQRIRASCAVDVIPLDPATTNGRFTFEVIWADC